MGASGASIAVARPSRKKVQRRRPPLAIYAALGIDLNASISMSILLLAVSFVLLIAFRHWVGDRTSQG